MYLLNQIKNQIEQTGTAIPVEIKINNNFFHPPLFKAADNERVRKIVLEDLSNEGFNFEFTDDWTKERGKEWIFILEKI